MSSIYNTERLEKISQIMPQFSKVADVGDTVLFGLEGDPSFPEKYNENRPTGQITSIEAENDDDVLVTVKMSNGNTKKISSTTISPYDVWEFDDGSFQNVMARESRKAAARAEAEEYRGTKEDEASVSTLKEEILKLSSELKAEKEYSRNFHNTLIASMQEMANDICKLDSKNEGAEFCRVFRTEYTKMLNRAEKSVDDETSSLASVSRAFRGTSDSAKEEKASSVISNSRTLKATSSSKEKTTENYRGGKASMFSDADSVESDSDEVNSVSSNDE